MPGARRWSRFVGVNKLPAPRLTGTIYLRDMHEKTSGHLSIVAIYQLWRGVYDTPYLTSLQNPTQTHQA